MRLEARQANLEGAGAIGLARLVREALRMRPDRLVVGECRGEEVRELLTALNTGHDGGAGTLHANSLDDVPARLEALGALAGLGDQALARQVVSAIGLVLHVERGCRRRPHRRGRRADRCSARPDASGSRRCHGATAERRRMPHSDTVLQARGAAAGRRRTGAGVAPPRRRRGCRGRRCAVTGGASARRHRRSRDGASREPRDGWSDVAAAWRVATTVGAPLADSLRALAAALRDAQEAADDVRVALAEPAGTARLMGWLPLVAVALGAMLGFDTLRALVGSPLGLACLVAGLALIVAAQRWSAALVRRATPDGGSPRARTPSCSRSP